MADEFDEEAQARVIRHQEANDAQRAMSDALAQERFEKGLCRFLNIRFEDQEDREAVRELWRDQLAARKRWTVLKDKGLGAIIVALLTGSVAWLFTRYGSGK